MKTRVYIDKKRRLSIVAYIVLGILISFLSTISAGYFQKIIDDFTAKSLSWLTVGVYASILILNCILNYLDEYPSCKLSNGIYLDLKIRALKKMSRINYESYQGLGSGSSIQRIENGANAGKKILFDFYFRLIRELGPSVIFSLIFIASINKQVMLCILIGYIFVFIVTNLLLKGLYKVKAHILNHEEQFNKYLVRGLMEMVTFRVNKQFKHEIDRATESAQEVIQSKIKMRLIHEAFFAAFELFITIIKVIILIIGWRTQMVSIGGLVALLTLVDKAYSPIAIFNVIYVDYKLNTSAYERYVEFLELEDDHQLDNGIKVDKILGKITFDKMGFAYKDKTIFKDISLEIKPGSIIGFAGESGSGKSTLIKQIIGLIKPSSGQIKIDDKDLATLNLNDYYNHVTYISQEAPIFNGTIRENIIFDKSISDHDIMNVLEKVKLKGLIESLSTGLDTVVGERGIKLSGGERQRLALARIYFSKAQIIILDEATSAMDNVTEEEVMKEIYQSLIGKTVIVIAHRLNTIREADNIYVFKEGELLEEGSFSDLIHKDSYFTMLWKATQSKTAC